MTVTAPQFKVVVAGVENSNAESAGLMHPVLIDNDGNANTTDHNNKGQLSLRDKISTGITMQCKLLGS